MIEQHIEALVDLAQQRKSVSISMLQRRLKISHKIAKEVLDWLIEADLAEKGEGSAYIFVGDPDCFAEKLESKVGKSQPRAATRSAKDIFTSAFNFEFLRAGSIETKLEELSAEIRMSQGNALIELEKFGARSASVVGDLERYSFKLDALQKKYIDNIGDLKTKVENSLNHYEILEIADSFFSISEQISKELGGIKKQIDSAQEFFSGSLQQMIQRYFAEVIEAEIILSHLSEEVYAAQSNIAAKIKFSGSDKNLALASIGCAALAVIVAATILFFSWPLILHTVEYIREIGPLKSVIYSVIALAVAGLFLWLISSDRDSNLLFLGFLVPVAWLLYAYVGVGVVAGVAVGGFFMWRYLTKVVVSRLTERHKALKEDLTTQAIIRLDRLLDGKSGNIESRVDQPPSDVVNQSVAMVRTCELHRKNAMATLKTIKHRASIIGDASSSAASKYRDFHRPFFYGSGG